MNGLCVWFPTMAQKHLEETMHCTRNIFELCSATVEQRNERTQNIAEESMLCARAVIAMNRVSCHFAISPLL